MKIQLSEKVFLESDSMQFIIRKYTGRIDDKGNETAVNLGYFSSFKSALKHIIKMDLLNCDAKELYDISDELITIEKKIDNIITEVRP
jgi:hypothetical protein